MDRKTFLKTLAALPITAAAAMKLNELNKMTAPLSSTAKMPVLFLGHGSPMNAIEENEFVAGFRNIGKTIQIVRLRACSGFHDRARVRKFCFRQGGFCRRSLQLRRKNPTQYKIKFANRSRLMNSRTSS
ncbi:MAG: hypothetical protein ACKV1O_08920 [Saprospiraceae bacterium]